MKTRIAYADALARHPAAVASVLRDLRKSRSVHRKAAPEELAWFYHQAVRVTGLTVQELVGRTRATPTEKSLQEKLEDELARSSVALLATRGHWFGTFGPLDGPWPEIEATIRAKFLAHQAEMERLAKLSPEALDEERRSLFKTLSSSPGLIALLVDNQEEHAQLEGD